MNSENEESFWGNTSNGIITDFKKNHSYYVIIQTACTVVRESKNKRIKLQKKDIEKEDSSEMPGFTLCWMRTHKHSQWIHQGLSNDEEIKKEVDENNDQCFVLGMNEWMSE